MEESFSDCSPSANILDAKTILHGSLRWASSVSLAVPGPESLILLGEGRKGLVGAGMLCSLVLSCAPLVNQSLGMEPHPSCVQGTHMSPGFQWALFPRVGSWLLTERGKLVISRRASGWSGFAHLPVTSIHTCHRVSEVGGELGSSPNPQTPRL